MEDMSKTDRFLGNYTEVTKKEWSKKIQSRLIINDSL